ncbi:MFS transporter [Nocardia sp. NPDC058114]|uniref:MFS transporter n=1 Tax=Nocardia sp. NPDC058114 TaxID=3346346 RepID=UPI0036D96380
MTTKPLLSNGRKFDRGTTLISLLLATALIALDTTVAATAAITISDDLGGVASVPWLFSVYVLAQAVTVPIYGKLADTFGRKPILLIGIAVFAIGSAACGFAPNMTALIVARGVQGIGAGAILPISTTVLGDIYTIEERAKVQSYFASVWMASAVIGPLAGGFIAEFTSWRWIFLLNLPLTAAAGWMLHAHYAELVPRRPQQIDLIGAGLLAGGTGAFVLGLLEGGRSWTWVSVPSVGVFSGSLVLLSLFIVVERRAPDPVLPLRAFRGRVVVVSSVVSLLAGAVLLGLTLYVPTYMQQVLGTGALLTGAAIGALLLAQPLAVSFAGKLYLRMGFRTTVVVGSATTTVGSVGFLMLSPGSTAMSVAAACFLTGFGMGLVTAPTMIAAQASVSWSQRGIVTATNMFARSIGGAFGVAAFSAVVSSGTGGSRDLSSAAMGSALHLVFGLITGLVVMMLVASTLMPPRPGCYDPQIGADPAITGELSEEQRRSLPVEPNGTPHVIAVHRGVSTTVDASGVVPRSRGKRRLRPCMRWTVTHADRRSKGSY